MHHRHRNKGGNSDADAGFRSQPVRLRTLPSTFKNQFVKAKDQKIFDDQVAPSGSGTAWQSCRQYVPHLMLFLK